MFTASVLAHLNKRPKRFLSSKNSPATLRIKIPANMLDLMVGMEVADRYFILSILGFGGMSVVYLGKDSRTGEHVAVKTVRGQGLGDQSTVRRFKREAEVLYKLNHPRIVRVQDYGTTKRGQPFFVMEYLKGRSLADLLKKEGRLSAERTQDIFAQVCAAVGHAHKHGLIHRDLKPGNIVLSKEGGSDDYVKVVDFGIARFQEESQRLTKLGEVCGSPVYMSPEQCMGAELDARSDIYSLGVVMYQALTGCVPFLGKNYIETMTKQINQQPYAFNVVCPGLVLPKALEAVVLKAMTKDPDQRYQTAIEMKQDLEKALSRTQTAYVPDKPSKPETPGDSSTERALSSWLKYVESHILIVLIMAMIVSAAILSLTDAVSVRQNLPMPSDSREVQH